jgi:sec-independent protein translocase protein TatC
MPRKSPNEMTFLEHLEELRVRILWILGAAAVGTAGAFYFSPRLVALLLAPGAGKFQYIKPAEAFVVHIAVAFIAGLVVMSPFIFYQIWRFVAPGLLPKERHYVFPFVVATSACFASGVVFGYYMLFPAMRFFRSFQTDAVTADWTLGSYASMALRLMLATGLIFEAPVVIFFLARLGIVSPKFLTAKWKYIILLVFIVAAALTPGPDVFTQTILAAPLLVLYLVSIGVAWLAYPKAKPEAEEEEEGDEEEPPEEAEPRKPSPYAG